MTVLSFPRRKILTHDECARRLARSAVGDPVAPDDVLKFAALVLYASPDHCDATIGSEVLRMLGRKRVRQAARLAGEAVAAVSLFALLWMGLVGGHGMGWT